MSKKRDPLRLPWSRMKIMQILIDQSALEPVRFIVLSRLYWKGRSVNMHWDGRNRVLAMNLGIMRKEGLVEKHRKQDKDWAPTFYTPTELGVSMYIFTKENPRVDA